MTVDIIGSVEMHTFTDAELKTIIDALCIANSHYMELSSIMGRTIPGANPFRDFCTSTFAQQARDAAELQMKIEAGR